MQRVLQAALDKLVSPRSSHRTQTDALTTLERTLAELLLAENLRSRKEELALFLQLQDSFQCNIASRTLAWLVYHTNALRKLSDGKEASSIDGEKEINMTIQALSLLQGVALIHKSSKEYLGSKCSIEVFLELLSVCRHSKPFTNMTNSPSNANMSMEQQCNPSLASAILDTLLCVLVDSPPAIRAFEDAKGVELIVKTLKRAAIPRDVRIKCLEFLYFYLMDESSPACPSSSKQAAKKPSSPTKQRVAQPSLTQEQSFSQLSSPTKRCTTRPSSPSKPLSGSLLRESSKTSSAFSSGSSTSDSSGSDSSVSSFSSWSPTPTLSGTPPRSPTKPSISKLPEMQNQGPLAMLRKDVDFVPLSPKKAQISQLGLGNRRAGAKGPASPLKLPNASSSSSGLGQRRPSPLSRMASEDTLISDADANLSALGKCGASAFEEDEHDDAFTVDDVHTRTTEEKKEILGQLLGNVDALVEGVKKAGIWGLGD
ncbi:cell division control protein 14, SIN component-domain-containing protein [Phellopilus nigrolimitatus]|nr:cell division control protein 14, SIN component-domain-containing protein [Phellopilus nigrolimitatus]